MSKCENCISQNVCRWWENGMGKNLNCTDEVVCPEYKDKSLFVELPCKVGDEVYLIEFGKVQKGRINEINISASGNVVVLDLFFRSIVLRRNRAIYFTQFSNTIFLTKEEAEKKLKENNK